MEKLRVRAGNEELKVEGSGELIQREREAFYQHIKELEEVNVKARAEFAQRMKNDMAWYARMRQEKDAENAGKPMVVRTCGELQGTWEEIARAIKSGAEFKVGDYKLGSIVDGCNFTMVVTDVTDEYVRFESRDCVRKEIAWNKEGGTKGGYPASDVHKYLNEELWELLPEELRAVISPCERKTLVDGEEETFTANLFLPTASEVFDDEDCYGEVGLYEQLEYYKDRRHRIRGAEEGEDTECGWWLASVRSGNPNYACYVSGYGSASYSSVSYPNYGVPLCFCIKKS